MTDDLLGDDDDWLFDSNILETVDRLEKQHFETSANQQHSQLTNTNNAQVSQEASKSNRKSTKQVVHKPQQRQMNILEAFGKKVSPIVSLLHDDSPVESADLSAAPTPFRSSQQLVKKSPRQAIKFTQPVNNYAPHTSTHELCRENLSNWIYPINYPKRSYQFDIVKTSLFHNTLVCLPTGLGKTFIAAVVMFNYYRWFSKAKIMFMAPTKPLVSQQMEACFKITGLDQLDTAELNGSQPPSQRQSAWREKRVFFLTPQVLQNDIQSRLCNSEDIVLLVIDEAHRASGNYSYCQVVKLIEEINPNFRVLALSATPGNDLKSVQDVIDNLNISRIELRTEDSPDIQPYIHSKVSETISVQINEKITEYLNRYLSVLKFYLERLNKSRAVFETDPGKLSKFMILQLRNTWRARNRNERNQSTGFGEASFAILLSLYHAHDLLIRHGLTPFYQYLHGAIYGSAENSGSSGQPTKSVQGQLKNNQGLVSIIQDLKVEMALITFVGHPKLERLEALVLEHFSSQAEGTRVMIFSEFRDSVEEIVITLNKHRPLLRVMSFVGQAAKNGKGFTQKEQIKVINDFQNGGYNILVATSIGEEGLDIGEVDLIICYDAQSSPTRMLQRMGRTGRKRSGRVVTLVTEGKEEAQFQKVHASYKKVQNILSGGKLSMYQEDRRLLPMEFRPIPLEQVMTVPEYQLKMGCDAEDGSSSSVKRKSKGAATDSKQNSNSSALFDSTEWRIYNTLYRKPEITVPQLDSFKHLHWQSFPHRSLLGHGQLCESYVALLKRFEEIQANPEESQRWLDKISAMKSDDYGTTYISIPKKKRRKSSLVEKCDIDRIDSATLDLDLDVLIADEELDIRPDFIDSKKSRASIAITDDQEIIPSDGPFQNSPRDLKSRIKSLHGLEKLRLVQQLLKHNVSLKRSETLKSSENGTTLVQPQGEDFFDDCEDLLMSIDIESIDQSRNKPSSEPADVHLIEDDDEFKDLDVDLIAVETAAKEKSVFKVPLPKTPSNQRQLAIVENSSEYSTPSQIQIKAAGKNKRKIRIDSPLSDAPSSSQTRTSTTVTPESIRRTKKQTFSVKRPEKSEFIEYEASVGSDEMVSSDENSSYASSLNGFIVNSSELSPDQSSPGPHTEPSQVIGSKYRMRFQGSVTLSQKVVNPNHRYVWAQSQNESETGDDAGANQDDEDFEDENLSSFVVDDDFVEYETQYSDE